MTSFTPVSLSGDNLGQRHRQLNSLVRDAAKSGAAFHDVEALPEHSPLDRLFKIDLAVKLQHVDYIIRNLQHDDMLFVSRALKSTWLLDHHEIINPKYLEDILFPEMVTPAVSKMKHWLYINLREPTMCQEFYQHYKENTFEFAIKFLTRCSQLFLLEEVPNILTKLTPHYLKVLCEKFPRVAKIYFDSLATDEDLRTRYLDREKSYYNSIKCVLKSDADVFLDITEKYFNVNNFKRLSSTATDYILRHHKTRFTSKLELYVAYFLHIPSLAARLSVEECQDVVIRLARAKYLQHWFQYKVVEPLIKRLSPDKRAAFKKRVFVQKDVGEGIEEWAYELPESPKRPDGDPHIFDDEDYTPVCGLPNCYKRMLKKRKCSRFDNYAIVSCEQMKSELDRLFDEFRFVGFDRALHDLSQRLGAAGSADRRRDIFLVLVSKSGGRSDAVSALLRLAVRHSNEPAHTRAAVLRSLVKRANVWRLPDEVWQNLLEFGHGLGLNGTTPEAACREGLHAVIIRQLLSGECEPSVCNAFLNDFSTLEEYSSQYSLAERSCVANGLQKMLLAAASEKDPKITAKHLSDLLDVIKTYHIHVEPSSPMVEAVRNLAMRDADTAQPLLERLYNARIARRELLRVNLKFRCDQGAFINALRHDPSAIDLDHLTSVISTGEPRFDQFISKLVVYFDQATGITMHLRTALKEKIVKEQKVKCVRSLAILLGHDFEKCLIELDAVGKELIKCAAALRACAHRARPVLNLVEWGWRKAGVKAVATRAMCCREVERAELTRALATDRRTVRLALTLSVRSAGVLLIDTFTSAAQLRPVVALRVALLYFRRYGASVDTRVWDIVKPLFSSVDLTSRERLRQLLGNTGWIPPAFKSDYCATLYLVIDKISGVNTRRVLRDLCTLLPEIRDDTFETILNRMLEKSGDGVPAIPFPAIFVRYLMLSRSENDFEYRFTKIGDRFIEILDSLLSESNFQKRLDQIIECLRYNAAFFNTKYTSCLLVIERLLAWMQKFMPKEEYFDKYVYVHLTMLYHKAVRQSVKQMPEVFADPKRKKSEGVEAVGFVFGRYIAKEVAQLVNAYFDSIIEIYADALDEYLGNFAFGLSRAKFFAFVLKGIIAEGVESQRRMAVYILKNRHYDMEDDMTNDIKNQLSKDKDIEFFVHAELLS